MFSFNSLCMQHVSLAVGGARWGRGGVTAAKGRWSWAAGEGHGGAAGRQTGQRSSVLLRFQLPLAAAHGRDEGSPLAAAVFGEQEVDVTFWGEFLHRLLEDP